MKNTTKLLAGITATMLIASSISGVNAMNGQWQWNGQGQQKWKMEQQDSMQKSSHNPADVIADIEMSDLSETERNNLIYSYAEETLAHDMYMFFYELYGTNTFLNIANSESEHQAAVKSLLDRYNIDIPSDYGELNDEFEELKAKGELSLKDALEVGVSIEILDIEDIAQTIIETDNDDIKAVFVNIWWASYNHLRWFVSALNNNSLTTDLDYNQYLTDEEIADKNIIIKQKMAEKVISAWVVLPEGFSPEDIVAKCEAENAAKGEKWQGSNWQWNAQWQAKGSGNGNKGGNSYANANNNKYINDNVIATKNRYKDDISTKYWNTISKISDTNLENLISRIDESIESINNSLYSDSVKEKYTSILLALRELTIYNLSN